VFSLETGCWLSYRHMILQEVESHIDLDEIGN
jgi:hypothetical protein